MGSDQATQLHKQLVQEWNKGASAQPQLVNTLLAQLKVRRGFAQQLHRLERNSHRTGAKELPSGLGLSLRS